MAKDEPKNPGATAANASDTITMTKGDLQDLLAGAMIKAKQLMPDTPSAPVEPSFGDKLEAMRHQPGARERRIPCTSEDTGATFWARVVESKGFPQGRIIELLEYKHPAGVDKHEIDGGRVPSGLPIGRPDNGHPTPEYKHWLWEEFWLRDLKSFVGKAFQGRYQTENTPPVPWPAVAEPVAAE